MPAADELRKSWCRTLSNRPRCETLSTFAHGRAEKKPARANSPPGPPGAVQQLLGAISPQVQSDRCAYCWSTTDFLLCYLGRRSICTDHANYIGGGGESTEIATGERRRQGGAIASCKHRPGCYQQQMGNKSALSAK